MSRLFHRKALAADDALVFLGGAIGLILIILVFGIYNVDKQKDISGEIQLKIQKANAQRDLQTFLNKEVLVGSKKISMANYIILRKSEEGLKENADAFFAPLYFQDNEGGSSWKSWQIKIGYLPEGKSRIIKGKPGNNPGDPLEEVLLAQATLPLPESEEYIKIEFYKWGRGKAIEPT